MEKKKFLNAVLQRKVLVLIIIILLVIVVLLFEQKQEYRYRLLYGYQRVPDIELINTFDIKYLTGEIRGFVKFDNISDQPIGLKQYYIIKPIYSKGESPQFSLETIIKMSSLSPRSIGVTTLALENQTGSVVTLIDEEGNLFSINKFTGEVSMKDMTGDSVTLITSELEYNDFVEARVLKK